ncbi:hypothetical protein H310_02116 [Aphanomyces invadans]|uniref:Uncharacterized protein n=2 Tax=Aphanomyces invadans TaxID=157072 RepID=A0A024UN91_9STRA|nr:hypothetical protein H310_02116 [Aphanomyces invadans]ETW07650.1 hypothetical protein H310_02116 [Aphanomyces invadans]|eukprot:XP_008863743.1 hypothetical protein H310_02116 [Aphanomyces invadans]
MATAQLPSGAAPSAPGPSHGVGGGDVFNKDTFLTALRDASGDGGPAIVAAAYEPKGMASVREKYTQLHGVVGSLSEKITAVLVRQEKDFLAAYRAHMYNVQKELHDTKEKILRNETLENKSEKIKLLEEERDWYRKEALRLDTFTTNMKKDLKHLKEKLECIEEDRDWLEKQLKASKKQNKLLRAELEIRLANLTSQAEDAMATRPPSPAVDDMEHNSSAGLQLPLAAVEREEQFRKQIRQLKRELLASKRDVNRLRETTSKQQSNELEEFFVQSIDAVKKDIVRRRSHIRDSKTRPIPALKAEPVPGMPLVRVGTTSEVGGWVDCGPEMKEFTAADRVRVIERLLSHDEVLSILYDNLFPSHEKKPPDGTKAPLPAVDSTKKPQQQPAGSGAAAVVASRELGNGVGASSLPLDTSTLEYLKLGGGAASLR